MDISWSIASIVKKMSIMKQDDRKNWWWGCCNTAVKGVVLVGRRKGSERQSKSLLLGHRHSDQRPRNSPFCPFSARGTGLSLWVIVSPWFSSSISRSLGVTLDSGRGFSLRDSAGASGGRDRMKSKMMSWASRDWEEWKRRKPREWNYENESQIRVLKLSLVLWCHHLMTQKIW